MKGGMQFGVHAALGSTNQTDPLVVRPPFFDRRLFAVGQALREIASITTVLGTAASEPACHQPAADHGSSQRRAVAALSVSQKRLVIITPVSSGA
jgi:hypothetical protein